MNKDIEKIMPFSTYYMGECELYLVSNVSVNKNGYCKIFQSWE